MAQAKKVFDSRADKAMAKLNDNNPRTLTDDMEIVMRGDDVILRTRRVRFVDRPNGRVEEHETFHERICNTPKDAAAREAGITPWWEALLKQQKVREAAAKKRPSKKESE